MGAAARGVGALARLARQVFLWRCAGTAREKA
jgi:hypothetical protein